jgi:glyoxylase-like metal-dependent hydrolase (beta-lactamase superfamily II)
VLQFGRYRVASLPTGTFALDGGAVFGVVPRPRWERRLPPDQRHRVRLAARSLLALDRDAGRVILVDTGLGDRWDDAARDLLDLRPAAGPGGADGLLGALARHGLGPADVTDVILTHLHFAHAGGATVRGPGGALALAFPRATHHVQRQAWHQAHAPGDRDRAAFREEDLALLAHAPDLHLVDGETSPLPDVELVVSHGHTPGQQLPRLHGDGSHLTWCGDLIPTHHHLRPGWVMAYDLDPAASVDEKKVLLAEALEDGGILAFAHDEAMAGCRLGEEEGRPVFREAVDL